MKIKALSASIALMGLSGAAAEELSDTGLFLDGVAAIVNEGVVLKSQLSERITTIIQQAREAPEPIPLPPADILRDQVLERLIIDEIQLQRADRIGLQISDPMLNETIADIARSEGVPFEQLPE